MIDENEYKLLDLLPFICDSMIYITDVRNNMTKVTYNTLDMFDLPGENTYNIMPRWYKLIHPDDLSMFQNTYHDLIQGAVSRIKCEYRVLNKFGSYVTIIHRAVLRRNEKGEVDTVVGSINWADSESRYDETTQLLNVHEFQYELERICKSTGERGAIIVFGFDNFGYVNKIYGYTFGNEVLRSFAKSILNSMNQSGNIYRLDGDKFAIIIKGGGRNDIRRCFSIIQKIAETPYVIQDKNITHTVSAGAVLYPENGQSKEVLYRNLDNALNEAKLSGKNKIVYFSDELAEQAAFSLRLLDALKDSINKNCEGFELYYQALIDARTDKLYGCEALIRWKHPDFPPIGSNVFIPLLEDSGFIDDVGRWIIMTALTQLRKWLKLNPDFKMNVNVSYLQFKNPQFKHFVVEQLKRFNIRPSSLIIELTESCRVTDIRGLQNEFKYLRDNGILMALDDFGMGYSSLGILRELSADMVKLDHTFVIQIADSVLDKAIIENIVNICHAVNILVCVEGIENETIFNIVKAFKPDNLQGYYFSKPIPAGDFERLFDNAVSA